MSRSRLRPGPGLCARARSLAHGGAGLGTVWGRQTAVRMLEEAGLVDVDVREVRTDPFNYFYVARRP